MKNHPAFDCQLLVSENDYMNLQPTTPATAPVEDMAAPQNQIPSSHAKYAGRFEKKRITLSHSPYVVGWSLLFVFGLQLSENHLFHGRFVLEITGS